MILPQVRLPISTERQSRPPTGRISNITEALRWSVVRVPSARGLPRSAHFAEPLYHTLSISGDAARENQLNTRNWVYLPSLGQPGSHSSGLGGQLCPCGAVHGAPSALSAGRRDGAGGQVVAHNAVGQELIP